MSQNKGKIAAGHKVKPHKPGVLPTPSERRRRDQLTSASDATMHVAKKSNVYDPNLPYVNVGAAEFTPWLAPPKEIRQDLIDIGVVALSFEKNPSRAEPSKYMPMIVERVLYKFKTGKFIWAGDLSALYGDCELFRDIMERRPDTNAKDLLIDGLVGWCDEIASHIVMTWIKDDGFHLVCMECVRLKTQDDDVILKSSNAVAVVAYIYAPAGTPGEQSQIVYRMNAGFYDNANEPPQEAPEVCARSVSIVQLVSWLMETNDAAYVREKSVNRGARRPPLPSYRTVVPDGYVTAVEALRARRAASEPQGGHHASPTPHDRRGHWVTNKKGKRFWRRAAQVLGGAEKAAQLSLPVRGHYEVRT